MNVRVPSLITLFIVLLMSCAHAGDRILSYHSDVVIHEDTSMTVKETITVSVGGKDIKHGIFRDFPTNYRAQNGLLRKRGFKVIKVRLNDRDVHYKLEKIQDGRRVRIGLATVRLKPGTYRYSIEYKTTRQLGYFDKHDELYWNITGNGWKFPIDAVTATVMLPKGASVKGKGVWIGKVGSKLSNAKIDQLDGGRVKFTSLKKLRSYEGMSFSVSFSKGYVDYSRDRDSWQTTAKDNPEIALMSWTFLLILVVLLVGWFREGRDPLKGTIIPRYKAPEGFSAAAVRCLRISGFDDTVFTAAILSLAAKGGLIIRDVGDRAVLKKRSLISELFPDEKDLRKQLFSKNKRLELDPQNANILITAKSKLQMNLRSRLDPEYYRLNSKYIIMAMFLFCIALLGIGLFLDSVPLGAVGMHFIALGCLWLFSSSLRKKWNGNHRSWMSLIFTLGAFAFWYLSIVIMAQMISQFVIVMCIASELLIFIFSFLMKAYTKLGRKTLDEIEGLRLYLKVAEKDRLELENPPERTPEHFEEFLPFALALGVDQQWAEQFHDVLAKVREPGSDSVERSYTPSFYQGDSSGLGVAGLAATTAIASTLGVNLSAASASPSSSGGGSYSGGGGYSSGGSSGGGGGGGGGGGW